MRGAPTACRPAFRPRIARACGQDPTGFKKQSPREGASQARIGLSDVPGALRALPRLENGRAEMNFLSVSYCFPCGRAGNGFRRLTSANIMLFLKYK